MTNKVRISAGEWRGRRLSFPEAPGLRPTPERVRQTLFNWLGQQLFGKTCLDLFAGSGALGFEALSRGAAAAVLVEQEAAVHRALTANAALLEAKRARILRMDARQFLAQNKQTFDIILLDPPFGQNWPLQLLPQLAPHLAADGVVYLEAEAPLAEQAGWQIYRRGKAGNVCYHLLKSAHAQ